MEDGYKCKPLYMNINGRLVMTGYRVVDWKVVLYHDKFREFKR
jgi:hypothetical protein